MIPTDFCAHACRVLPRWGLRHHRWEWFWLNLCPHQSISFPLAWPHCISCTPPLVLTHAWMCLYSICDRIYILTFFKRPPLKGTKSHRLYSWFIGTPAFLRKKSNVRKCSYVLAWNSGAPKWGMKRPISNCVWYSRLPRPYWTLAGAKVSAGVEQWLKNQHTWFQDCSY